MLYFKVQKRLNTVQIKNQFNMLDYKAKTHIYTEIMKMDPFACYRFLYHTACSLYHKINSTT